MTTCKRSIHLAEILREAIRNPKRQGTFPRGRRGGVPSRKLTVISQRGAPSIPNRSSDASLASRPDSRSLTLMRFQGEPHRAGGGNVPVRRGGARRNRGGVWNCELPVDYCPACTAPNAGQPPSARARAARCATSSHTLTVQGSPPSDGPTFGAFRAAGQEETSIEAVVIPAQVEVRREADMGFQSGLIVGAHGGSRPMVA